MFTNPAPAAPPISTTSSQAAPTSPTRPSRLRGLSYLRSYTYAHLHSGSNSSSSPSLSDTAPPVTRSRSSPSVADSLQVQAPTESHYAESASGDEAVANVTPAQRSSTLNSVAGWIPSVGLRSSVINSSAREDGNPELFVEGTAEGGITYIGTRPSIRAMTRNRADTAAPTVPATRTHAHAHRSSGVNDSSEAEGLPKDSQMPTIRLSPHQDTRSNRPSLAFPSISRTLPSASSVIHVGRYSERDSVNTFMHDPNPSKPSQAPVGFKSKVVSRRHCEFWCQNGQWYIKDVGSSSGTFLNHIRLSQPGVESKPYAVSDGDVVQLGIDFRGGEEMIFRCVKIRVECNRGWQKGLNKFNKQTHRSLKNLSKKKPKVDGDNASTHSSECSICLMSIAPCQSLFVAPCSHVWHYKCIRPILNGATWPNFLCPNCRAVADLEADVDEGELGWSEEDDAEQDPDVRKAIEASLRETQGADVGRTNGDGEVMRSIDVTEAIHEVPGRAGPIDPALMLDDQGLNGAVHTDSQSSDSRGRAGFRSASETIRLLRNPRSSASISSGRQSGKKSGNSARESHPTVTDGHNAHIGAPSRTPPPPPKDRAVSENNASRQSFPRSRSDEKKSSTAATGSRIPSGFHLGSAIAPTISAPTSPLTPESMHHLDELAAMGQDNDGAVKEDEDETRMDWARTITIQAHSGSRRLGDTRELNRRESSNEGNELSASREIGGPDCPMTPRNDAGPFILDGSGGRS